MSQDILCTNMPEVYLPTSVVMLAGDAFYAAGGDSGNLHFPSDDLILSKIRMRRRNHDIAAQPGRAWSRPIFSRLDSKVVQVNKLISHARQ